MRISTKFRLKYLTLFIALASVGYVSFLFENGGLFMAVGIFIIFFGQLIILGTSSAAKCPTCGTFIFNTESKNSKLSIGYQTPIFQLLFGRCSSCKSKL